MFRKFLNLKIKEKKCVSVFLSFGFMVLVDSKSSMRKVREKFYRAKSRICETR